MKLWVAKIGNLEPESLAVSGKPVKTNESQEIPGPCCRSMPCPLSGIKSTNSSKWHLLHSDVMVHVCMLSAHVSWIVFACINMKNFVLNNLLGVLFMLGDDSSLFFQLISLVQLLFA